MSCKMDANRHGTGYDQQCQFEPTTAILTLQFPPGRSTTGPAANVSLSTSVLTSSGSLLAKDWARSWRRADRSPTSSTTPGATTAIVSVSFAGGALCRSEIAGV